MLRITARALRMATAQPAARRAMATTARVPAAAGSSRTTLGVFAAGGLALGYTAYAAQSSSQPAVQCWFWGSSSKTDWAAVDKDIRAIIEDNYCGPMLVRLAWHASGTYVKETNTGGSNGATMRFTPEAADGANAGLDQARDLLEPLKAKYPDASYADLWTFAGKVAIESMGGPSIKWKEGRTDAADESACPPNGRLPDAAQGSAHIRDVFYRMGFNDREIVALSGAHTLGFCHTDRSGYEGPWTQDPNKFDNDYFKLLVNDRWTVRPDFQPLQFEDSSKTLMMLPTDIALITDPKFRPTVAEYANDEQLFFKDFAAAFATLLEQGVPR